eukprot:gene47867-64926_t
MPRDDGIALAHHLGRALQLTNILRDIDEDAAIGRAYLAREHVEAVGIALKTPLVVIADPRIDMVCRQLAAIARDHYRAAAAILRRKPPGHLLAPRLMEAVYAQILRRMEQASWVPPRTRIKPAGMGDRRRHGRAVGGRGVTEGRAELGDGETLWLEAN